MANLTPVNIEDSYQSVLTTSETTSDPTTGTLQNGKGSAITTLTVSGTVNATTLGGTLSTASQPNVTSVGTLSSATISGDLTVDTSTLKVDSANNRVGIGTASPASSLDIRGTGLTVTRITGGGGNDQGSGYYVFKSDNSATLMAIGDSSSILGGTPDQAATMFTNTNIPLTFVVSASERMRIDASGNVGIGETAPQVLIHGKSSDARLWLERPSGSHIEVGAGASSAFVYNRVNAPLVFGTNNTERMRIDASGTVGIGVTPSNWTLAGMTPLQIRNASFVGYLNNAYVGGNVYYDTNWRYIANAGATLYSQFSNGEHQWANAPSGTAGNEITFTERMRIDASGNVGIGTASPAARLDVTGLFNGLQARFGNTAGRGLYVSTALSGGTNEGTSVIDARGAGGGALSLQTESVERMRIDASGNVDVAGGDIGVATLVGRAYNTGLVASQNPNLVNGSGFNSIPIQVGDIITFFDNQVRTVTNVTDTQLTVNAAWTTSFAGVSASGEGGLGFDTNNVERMRIDSLGQVGIGLTPTTRNNTRLQIVDGIGFPATAVASSDANTLDDYEEGTFTPTASSGITINTINNATYTKIGNTVTFQIWIKVDIGSADFVIAGLPFTGSGRTAGSMSNTSEKETIANLIINNEIYGFAATTVLDDDLLIGGVYRVA
jgi:hypothetical protein